MSAKRIGIAVWTVAFAGCLIGSLNLGTRTTFGLFQTDILRDLAIAPSDFGLAIAVQNLMWGVATPFMGAVADKYGSMRMMILGALLYAAGLWVMGTADGLVGFHVGAGLLIGIGMGGVGFGVVLGAVGRRVPVEQRSLALGVASAGGSFGQFYMAPVGQALLETQGWTGTLTTLALIMLFAVPLAFLLARQPLAADAVPVEQRQGKTAGISLGEALGEAYRHVGFNLLTLGFFVCGFQVAFITVHFPKYLEILNIDLRIAALALSLIGLCNIVGTFVCGALGGRFPKKWVLAWLYALRSLCIIAMLAAPKTETNILLFAGAMGLLWLGTVPLTSGLVANMFGVRYLSMLFGITFLSHQVGSFLGVWLGGYLYQTTGSYDLVWYGSIALGFAAAALHLPISEKHPAAATA
ncbi:MAG: MFS transporter [Rhodospirillales bacterium CG15_BIG_FIL_POST_REV_8_21_14_020_66_15]|nr:MAG: MFS transporter [Rhodospirillales bacterium CG15_BIG_FIL_POST_REV_8_21_14_020_66_15]